MTLDHKRRWCRGCRRHVLAQRPGTNHTFHLLVTLFTCGLWIIVWLLSAVKIGGWRCPNCGRRC